MSLVGQDQLMAPHTVSCLRHADVEELAGEPPKCLTRSSSSWPDRAVDMATMCVEMDEVDPTGEPWRRPDLLVEIRSSRGRGDGQARVRRA